MLQNIFKYLCSSIDMAMPGFTAESSAYTSKNRYIAGPNFSGLDPEIVMSQLERKGSDRFIVCTEDRCTEMEITSGSGAGDLIGGCEGAGCWIAELVFMGLGSFLFGGFMGSIF
jgi:hypothetical protein